MKRASTFLIAVTGVSVLLGTGEVCSPMSGAQRSKLAALNGRVGATKSDGEVLPPESATIYILFSSAMEGRLLSHPIDLDTAGRQFRHHLNNLLARNKELKRLQKSVRRDPRPGDADEIAAYYLQSVDEALTRVRSWLTRHPDRSWQMKMVTPDVRGFWSMEGLQPGEYNIVVRGTLAGYDVDWEAGVDLAPGRMISLALTRPRFFRHQ